MKSDAIDVHPQRDASPRLDSRVVRGGDLPKWWPSSNPYVIGDCLEIMPKLPDKSIDMILCDLPYGTTQNPNDIALPLDKVWREFRRLIKPNGAIVLTAQQPFATDLINSCREIFRYDLIWDKVLITGFLNANRMPLRTHEHILVFYSEQPTYNAQKFIGKATHGGTAKQNVNNNYGDFVRPRESTSSTVKCPVSIVHCAKPHPSVARHPTEKPLKLFEYLIKTYTDEGDVVFDGCLGSGTTLEAAFHTRRVGLGCEINPEYEGIIKERSLSQITRLDAFAIAPPSNRKGGVSCPTNPQEILTQVTSEAHP
jgi:site-specific DNA-methyltransferase (adenine-specific)